MKTLRSMMLGLAMLATGSVVYAAPVSHHNNATKGEVVNTYVDAVVYGDLSNVSDAIADNAQFYTIRGAGTLVNAHTKQEMMDYLKSEAALHEHCACTSTVLQDSGSTYIEKVEMKYKNLTRTDVITAHRDGDEWKITKVETSYK